MTGASSSHGHNFLLPLSAQAATIACAVNAAGNGGRVRAQRLFKSVGGSGKSQLSARSDAERGRRPTRFLQDQSSRFPTAADWSWVTGVALNFARTSGWASPTRAGAAFRSLGAQTGGHEIPTWFPDGRRLRGRERSRPIPGDLSLAKHDQINSRTGRHRARRRLARPACGAACERQSGQPELIAFAGQRSRKAPQ